MNSSRRVFLAQGAIVSMAALSRTESIAQSNTSMQISPADRHGTSDRPLIVSTWPFGKPSNERALEVFKAGGSALDAVEKGINLAEEDLSNSSVGAGGIPNAAGIVQLDACIMDGPTHKAGSVGALEGIVNAVSVARRVMEKTRHVMLVGAGARAFAVEQGFREQELLTPEQKKRWEEWKKKQSAQKGHDTIALLALAPDGTIAGGCSTSGLAYKVAGRVGDSPIIGSGLYVDNDVGAAGATGIGENIMRFCGSFMVVELMRSGMHPVEACVETIRRIKRGEYGAAGTGKGFEFAAASPAFSKVIRSPGVTSVSVGVVGGNVPKESK
jgi:isoaspartyl peptidase/L-asparaginase-like protein (Ntn-hydrolase superfamily)